MNLFTPARGANESRAQYIERRAQAKRCVEAMTLTGAHSVHGGVSSRKQERDRAARLRAEGKLHPHRRFADVLMAAWARKRREVSKKA